jgi:Acyl-CoA thioesterase C-terminal domain/Acyl-CoA thioesterase N-terminal domain
MTAFFTPSGDRFAPSELTRGPWDPEAQHAGPPAALLGRAVEAPGTRVARIAIEILRPVPLVPLTVASRVLRPGRNVELVAAELTEADGAAIALAHAWRLRAEPSAPEPADDAPPPGPDAGAQRPFFAVGDRPGYHTAMDVRFLAGGFTEPGPARAWMRMRGALVAGEQPSPLVRVLVAADSGNGISGTRDPRSHLFINTELTVHLFREPTGEWVLLDAVTRIGPDGVGLAETALSDRAGRIGRAAQALLIRAR